MKLSKQQLQQLKRGKQYRETPPTLFRMIWSARWRYGYIVGLFGGVAIYAGYLGEYIFSALLTGYLLGVVYRDVQWLYVFKRYWPVSVEITNWQRVDELIQENDTRASE